MRARSAADAPRRGLGWNLLLILLGALLVLVAALVANALFPPAPLEIHNLGGNLTQLGATTAAA